MIGGVEACDGDDLGGQTCATVGAGSGFVSCAADCTLDTSACFSCGDGMRNGDEECDGFDFEEPSCQDQGCIDCIWECNDDCVLDLVYCCDDQQAC